MDQDQKHIAVLGASGYTGAETIRLLQDHPLINIAAVSANRLAGQRLETVFPHLRRADLVLQKPQTIDWQGIDAVFSCLPHGTGHDVLGAIPDTIRVIDLSADFRFRDLDVYAKTYGMAHPQTDLAAQAVYGLSELYTDAIGKARLVACPGCYPTATLLALIPLVRQDLISPTHIIIDAKSGVSGAGRGLKEGNLFCEAAEGLHPYGIGNHRHAPEIDEQLSINAGQSIQVSFTPHLVPMTRGELITLHLQLENHRTLEGCHEALKEAYKNSAFIDVLPIGSSAPDTRHVRGTNICKISLHNDRISGRIVIIAVIDNLIKGSSGQAIQNFNMMMGWPEGLGLTHLQPLFP